LSNRSIGFEEIRFEVDVKERTSESFHTVGDGEDGDALSILDIGTGVDGDDIAQTNAVVGSYNTVDTGHSVVEVIIGKNDQNGVLSLLALDENGITSEKAKRFHCV
jgi:hypothetical protein